MCYCLIFESRRFNLTYADHSTVQTAQRPSAVFVSHPGELEPVHVAPAQRLLLLKG